MKVPIAVTIAVAVLTSATWVFFYVATPQVPLNATGTTIVAAFWFLVVLAVYGLVRLIKGKRG